jgi:Peptidase family M28
MTDDRPTRIRELIEFLCSPACMGRLPGSPGGLAARDRIVAEFEATGVEPAGEEGWLQAIPAYGGANVIGRVPGDGPLAERAILVGAHYDHLGPAIGRQAYWGADDNAAAVAILLEVARQLATTPPGGRQVLLVAFDGEEPPHFLNETMGSMHYARRPVVPLNRTDTMVCMDLVGHALGPAALPDEVRRSLMVLGAELSQGTGALVDAAGARARGVVPRRLALDVIPDMSDYHAFRLAQVPVLFLTCGRWEHYHEVTDTPDRLDYPKIAATADFLAELTRSLATRPEVPVVFEADGQDDVAMTRTLLEVGAALAPFTPQIEMIRPIVEGLQTKARQGRLSPGDHQTLCALVGGLEDLFAQGS